MFSLPVTGSNGMLWYTASSVKNAARSSAPRSLAHAAQNLLADHAAVSVRERAAGVARVQRRVGLDHVVDDAPPALIGTARPSPTPATAVLTLQP
jgi:hypothetical protein